MVQTNVLNAIEPFTLKKRQRNVNYVANIVLIANRLANVMNAILDTIWMRQQNYATLATR